MLSLGLWLPLMAPGCFLIRPCTTTECVDTGGGTESGHTGETGETGERWYGAPVTVSERGVLTCEDPDARATGGPMHLYDPGTDWDDQAVPPDNPGSFSKGRGVAIEDFNLDGLWDLFIPNLGADQLFFGAAGATVDDVTDTHWHTGTETTTATVAVDYDDDGDMDITSINRGSANALWQNDGTGKFTEVPRSVTGWDQARNGSTGGAWGDINGDGHLDLFIYAHFVAPTPEWDENNPGPADPSELYLSNGDGTFEDISDMFSEEIHGAYTYAGGLHDLDLDGDLDIVFVNDLGSLRIGNKVLRNDTVDGVVAFTEISNEVGLAAQIFGMGLGVGEINGDGIPDLLTTGWDELLLFESVRDGTWFDSAASKGILWEYEKRDIAWAAEFADMDNDGLEDLHVNFGMIKEEQAGLGSSEDQPDALFQQDSDGNFHQVAEAWELAQDGQSRGLSVADLNHDGFLDVVKRALDGDATMYMSQCDDSSFVILRLHQPAPNIDAVGARIELTIGETTQTRWIRAGGTSYASSHPVNAHFGLGDADTVDRILVTWPNGDQSAVYDLTARQTIDITRAGDDSASTGDSAAAE